MSCFHISITGNYGAWWMHASLYQSILENQFAYILKWAAFTRGDQFLRGLCVKIRCSLATNRFGEAAQDNK